jgi:YtkA-like
MNKLAHFSLVVMLGWSLSGCSLMKPPVDLDVRMEKPSAQGAYVVSLHPSAAAPLNRIHTWEIAVRDSAGQPVENARISLSGGMPQHHHSFPTKPEVTEALGGGRYLLDGVKFSMTGWWDFRLVIDANGRQDTVTFNTVVTEQGTRLDGPGPT